MAAAYMAIMDDVDLVALRRNYTGAELTEGSVLRDPIAQLRLWLNDARDAGILELNAMCLATCAGGRPSARMVLLRGLDDRGLSFYTSYFSRKGVELEANPHAAAVFYWGALERQVRAEGVVERLSEEESDAYFTSRPRGHRLSAWASEQSEIVEDRAVLDRRLDDYARRFEGADVPRPHSWGGYALRPERIEFWQGRPNRMHDRLLFRRGDSGWTLERLQP
jgi:pyridoxamine 5'-phosphate oxidase